MLSLNRMISLVYFVSPFIVKWSEEMGYGEHYTWCTYSFSRLSPHEARLDFKLRGIWIWYQKIVLAHCFFPLYQISLSETSTEAVIPFLSMTPSVWFSCLTDCPFCALLVLYNIHKVILRWFVHLLPEVPVFIVKSSCIDYDMKFLVQCILYKIPTT